MTGVTTSGSGAFASGQPVSLEQASVGGSRPRIAEHAAPLAARSARAEKRSARCRQGLNDFQLPPRSGERK
jgi:hypothetical protein